MESVTLRDWPVCIAFQPKMAVCCGKRRASRRIPHHWSPTALFTTTGLRTTPKTEDCYGRKIGEARVPFLRHYGARRERITSFAPMTLICGVAWTLKRGKHFGP